jgi:hypothetical protein
MRRHDLDLTSLVAGLVFVAIAVAYVVAEYTDARISAGWVLPLGLIGLGLAGLAGTLRRGLRDTRVPVEPAPATPVDPEQHTGDET